MWQFGGLACDRQLNSANISYLHIYVWQSLTKPPNLNPPIFLQWRFRAQPPNLIPANISGYTVLIEPGLVSFLPLNCTCILEHSEINTILFTRY